MDDQHFRYITKLEKNKNKNKIPGYYTNFESTC